MTLTSPQERSDLLARAKAGNPDCLGPLLDQYRNYLRLVARSQLDSHLAARTSPSDVVQETFLQACHHFHDFRGSSEPELLAWLRTILVRNMVAAFHRNYSVKKRDVRRSISLEEIGRNVDQSASQLATLVDASGNSPSSRAQREELTLTVVERLAGLPVDYRDVIVLRNLEGFSFSEVAERMSRTPDAVRKLWARAIRKLQLACEDLEP